MLLCFDFKVTPVAVLLHGAQEIIVFKLKIAYLKLFAPACFTFI